MKSEIASKLVQASAETGQPPLDRSRTVNWPHVAIFLCLTFSLSWLLDLVLFLNGGLANPATGLLLQLQMLIPAFSALILGVFFFKESPTYYRTNRRTSRWFIYYYFLLTSLYLAGSIISLVQPARGATLSSILLIPNVIGLILLIWLRRAGGNDAFAGAGMAGGKAYIWVLFGLGLVAFYGLQTFLNYAFKLGRVVDFKSLFPAQALGTTPVYALLLSAVVNTVIIGPILGLIITFGEEYGWRGYLQGELTRLGRARGVLPLGIIWGVWHWPLIWMGYNYPGQPVFGSFLMVAYTVILAYFLAYAVFKSKGVWTAAYLHAVNNQVFYFYVAAIVAPTSTLFSFGLGIPGLALGALLVLLILRDPLWKATDEQFDSNQGNSVEKDNVKVESDKKLDESQSEK